MRQGGKMKRIQELRCINDDQWFGGVCAGVAYWLEVPTWTVRVAWAMLVLCYGVGVAFYLLLWIFLPNWEEDPADYEATSG